MGDRGGWDFTPINFGLDRTVTESYYSSFGPLKIFHSIGLQSRIASYGFECPSGTKKTHNLCSWNSNQHKIS